MSFVFASIFAVAAFGQTPPATKIGWIDTAQFADEKEGVTKYNNALKALDTEMKPRVTELTGLQTKLQNIAEENRTSTKVQDGDPVNQQVVGQTKVRGCSVNLSSRKKNMTLPLKSGAARSSGPFRLTSAVRSRIMPSRRAMQ